MRGYSRGRIGLVVAMSVGLVALAVAGAYGAKLSTKSETATLPADDAAHTVTAKCPKGAKATGGGTQISDDVNDYAAGSYPAGKRGWTAVGERYSVYVTDAEVTAFARCLKDAKLSTESKTLAIADDGATSVTAKCPKGTKVSGGGVELTSPIDDLAQGSFPSAKRKWTVEGRGGEADVIASARCLKGAKLTRRSETATLPSDDTTHTVTVTCPKGTKSTGGGGELSDPDNDYLQGFYPAGKRAWTAAGYRSSSSGPAAEFTAHVVCLKKPKKK
jgi:hypothetical protein